jgi:hypothetical protein
VHSGALFALVVFIAASVWLDTLAQRVVEKGASSGILPRQPRPGRLGFGSDRHRAAAALHDFPDTYTYGWVGGYSSPDMVVPLTNFAIIGKRIARSRKTGASRFPI